MGQLIPRSRTGLGRSRSEKSLSAIVARDPDYSHARPSDAPFREQTLGRLSVSRGLGQEVLKHLLVQIEIAEPTLSLSG